MNDKKIEPLFVRLKHDFDVEEPNLNHQNRFLDKLNAIDDTQNATIVQSKRNIWKPFIGIAASIVLLFTLFIVIQQESSIKELASVSPQMAETENFFTSTIALELTRINQEASPETESIINDAMAQMSILEKNYELLKEDLIESGDDKRVIYAMISNFQNRIDLLQNTLEHIINVKQTKINPNENSYTL